VVILLLKDLVVVLVAPADHLRQQVGVVVVLAVRAAIVQHQQVVTVV
jgi:hypothetical protein